MRCEVSDRGRVVEDVKVLVFQLSDELGSFHAAFIIYCQPELSCRDLLTADYCSVRIRSCLS